MGVYTHDRHLLIVYGVGWPGGCINLTRYHTCELLELWFRYEYSENTILIQAGWHKYVHVWCVRCMIEITTDRKSELIPHLDVLLPIPISFWLIIMWDCTAPKMHLTQAMYVICTWDWQQNLTYVWYVAPSTQKSALTCRYAPPTIYWL